MNIVQISDLHNSFLDLVFQKYPKKVTVYPAAKRKFFSFGECNRFHFILFAIDLSSELAIKIACNFIYHLK